MVKKLFNNKGLPREASAKWGFTLLELLVVIGIIAILVAVGTASYSTVQKKARDAKRKTDLKEIQAAAEQYYSVCGFKYPTTPGAIECTDPETMIMETKPTDPLTGIDYSGSASIPGEDYTICATLEAEKGNQPAQDGTYCVKNQQ